MENKEGTRVPEVTFLARKDGDWNKIESTDIFNGRKVVVFSLPGAFTPTCSTTHLPLYEEYAPAFKAAGVDEIVCLSVNDGFVMSAWAKNQDIKNVSVIPDGNGEFTEKLGFLVDKSAIGFGKRSWRYSMVVVDGVIEKMFIEPEKPGDPFEVSDAATMLAYLGAEDKVPTSVTIFTKPGCPFCLEAKSLLTSKGLHFEEIVLGDGVSFSTLANVTGKMTVPQLYIDGTHIDGLSGLKAHFG